MDAEYELSYEFTRLTLTRGHIFAGLVIGLLIGTLLFILIFRGNRKRQ